MTAAPRREPLPDGECHLWVVRVEESLAAGEARYLAWLADEEKARLRRYRFERHRREHLVTRALARAALSRYTGCPPEAWTFGAGPHGKPHLTGPAPLPMVAFNLANAGDLVVCALAGAPGLEVGVDAEPSEAPGDPLALAETAFSPAEVSALRQLPASERRERFISLWTLKEAYVKARGVGLSLPTERFTVSLEGETGAGLAFNPAVEDDPALWQLARVGGVPGYHLAVALRRPAGSDLRLRLRTSRTLDVHEI